LKSFKFIVKIGKVFFWPCQDTPARLYALVRWLQIHKFVFFKSVPFSFLRMGVWQGVAMDSLKFYPSLQCSTLIDPMVEPSLKQPYGRYEQFENKRVETDTPGVDFNSMGTPDLYRLEVDLRKRI
jgi:hypothetical protein